jgi:hypothetical protein
MGRVAGEVEYERDVESKFCLKAQCWGEFCDPVLEGGLR